MSCWPQREVATCYLMNCCACFVASPGDSATSHLQVRGSSGISFFSFIKSFTRLEKCVCLFFLSFQETGITDRINSNFFSWAKHQSSRQSWVKFSHTSSNPRPGMGFKGDFKILSISTFCTYFSFIPIKELINCRKHTSSDLICSKLHLLVWDQLTELSINLLYWDKLY